jgi:hypothetical protein
VGVGATQGAACSAAYEFLFNAAYQMRKHKVKVPITYVSAEPFAGHFGIGGLPGGETLLGLFFKMRHPRPELGSWFLAPRMERCRSSTSPPRHWTLPGDPPLLAL